MTIWRGSSLSSAGRLTLINSVLSAIASYLMSYYYFVDWVIKRIDKLEGHLFGLIPPLLATLNILEDGIMSANLRSKGG